MADIVAADVTSKNDWLIIGPDSKQPVRQARILVRCKITVDPGTTDAYPTGGIPLTVLFTSGTSNDSKLDINQPIMWLNSGAYMQAAAATFTPAFPVKYEQGSTPATNVLRLRRDSNSMPDALISGATLAVSSNTITDSASGFVAAGFTTAMIIRVAGFSGTLANNQVVALTTVAAGTLTPTGGTWVNDAAGEAVTIMGFLAPGQEFTNVDVTGITLFNGDTDPYVELWLMGMLREGESI